MTVGRLALALALLHPIVLIGCAEADAEPFSVGGMRFAPASAVEWKLPAALRELSGFTTDDEGRLFGHDDEQAVVHEIDYVEGGITKSFALGNPPLRGDFEGITRIGDEFVLTTSDGVLYLAREGGDGERVAYRKITTGLGTQCEIEGVEYVADDRLLYFACKRPRQPELKNRLTLLAWSPERGAEDPARSVRIDLAELDGLPGKGKVRPSGIARSPATGDFVLTAASHRALITLSRDGKLVNAIKVPDADSLPQIEAIAFGKDGALLIGSEGRKKRGRMRVYRTAD